MSDADDPLHARAHATTPADPAVRDCWYMIVNAIQAGWLDGESIAALIVDLRDERDAVIEELRFEHRGGGLQVAFLDDAVLCDRAALLVQLARLVEPERPGARAKAERRRKIMPSAARTAIVAALRAKSDHADALPDPLWLGSLLFPNDRTKVSREELRVLAGEDDQGYFLDYYQIYDRGESSWHGRARENGAVEDLENFEGLHGRAWFPDPADTERDRQRIGAHNDHVREILRRKGFA